MGASLAAQRYRSCLPMQGTQWIPGSGDAPEEEVAAHSSIFRILENSVDRGAWWGYSPWGCKESDVAEPRSAGRGGSIRQEAVDWKSGHDLKAESYAYI